MGETPEEAALRASQSQRDRDAEDALDPKTRKQYMAVLARPFYDWAKGNGRSACVREPSVGPPPEPISMLLINDGYFQNHEMDIITCFLSAMARKPDGSLWGVSKQQAARSAIVFYLKSQTPPRKMTAETDVAVKKSTNAHKRHIVAARASGDFKVGRLRVLYFGRCGADSYRRLPCSVGRRQGTFASGCISHVVQKSASVNPPALGIAVFGGYV